MASGRESNERKYLMENGEVSVDGMEAGGHGTVDVVEYGGPMAVLNRSKYVLSALCVTLLLVFIALVVLIVIVDVFNYKDDEDSWRGQPFVASEAAVATEQPLCSEMGAAIMAIELPDGRRGNAIDAAITADLCVCVLHCFATGVGGGGVMMVHEPDGNVTMLDFRETAPAASTSDMFVNVTDGSVVGGLASGVPGEFKGLYEAWQRYGSLPWESLVMPVAELAKNFTVDELLGARLEENRVYILEDPGLRAVFAPDGELLKEGDHCIWTNLSNTLTLVAQSGPQAFYEGELAEAFASYVQSLGGIITTADLAAYTVKEVAPLRTFYQGYAVYGAPPPYSGGAITALTNNIIEFYNFRATGNTQLNQHYLIEAWQFGYSDRAGMGDPATPGNEDMLTTFIPTMISKDHAALLRNKIIANATFGPEYYEDLVELQSARPTHGTSHLSTADRDGMAVALTSTINLSFGAKYLEPTTGIIGNNEMDDFSTPGQPNYFGYPPSEENYPYPGSRPLSSMTPTIVTQNGNFFLAIGASGGSKIPTATMNSIINYLDFGENLYDAIQMPRAHDQWVPSEVVCETGYPESWVEYLRGIGYQVRDKQGYGAVVQAVGRSENGGYIAVSDRRKNGQPAGF